MIYSQIIDICGFLFVNLKFIYIFAIDMGLFVQNGVQL